MVKAMQSSAALEDLARHYKAEVDRILAIVEKEMKIPIGEMTSDPSAGTTPSAAVEALTGCHKYELAVLRGTVEAMLLASEHTDPREVIHALAAEVGAFIEYRKDAGACVAWRRLPACPPACPVEPEGRWRLNLDGLPPELTTAAWQAAYAALDFTYPAEEFRDSNIRITTECSGGVTWGALFRKYWPCCGVHSDVSVVYTSGTLDDLAVTIRAGLATHDDPCPNADRHAREAQP